jgi:hypothetical protein
MEFVPKETHFYSGIIFFFAGVTGIFSPVLLVYAFKEVTYFAVITATFCIINLAIWILIYLPESPKYLIDQQKFERVFEDIKYICKFNNLPYDERIEQDVMKFDENRKNDDVHANFLKRFL